MKRTTLLVAFLPLAFAATAKEIAAPADEEVVIEGRKLLIPAAPAEFRRPEGWKQNRYPKSLQELADTESKEMMARGRALTAEAEAVIAKGRWMATGESIDKHTCPEWFVDAKLGIFIDWGLWSMASYCPAPKEAKRLYPDWYELRAFVDYPLSSGHAGSKEYHEKNWGRDFKRDDFIPLFKAQSFDAAKLCSIFKACNARYVVPFLKHHSGFSLWDSAFTHRDVVDRGPRRDLCRELVNACRTENLKFGFYFSLGEWEYPLLKDDNKVEILQEFTRRRPLEVEDEMRASGKVAVRDYVREYSVPQAVDFIKKYDPDILWYDYDWCAPATGLGSYIMSAYFYTVNEGRKEVCVNDRYGNGTPEDNKKLKTSKRTWLRTVRGDFYTDELGDTSDCISPESWHPWECCRSISRSFGNHWMDNETNVMSERAFICEFADIVAKGGNLLLLVNLDGQGAIPPVQEKRLREIGSWLDRYGKAIFATRIIAPYRTDAIDYTQSKDGRTVYAIVKQPAKEITLECKLPAGAVIKVVGTDERLATRKDGSLTKVELPAAWVGATLPFALECDVINAIK